MTLGVLFVSTQQRQVEKSPEREVSVPLISSLRKLVLLKKDYKK
jgi:hypothetical protein